MASGYIRHDVVLSDQPGWFQNRPPHAFPRRIEAPENNATFDHGAVQRRYLETIP